MDCLFKMITNLFAPLILFISAVMEINQENYLGCIAYALLGILAGIMVAIILYLKEDTNE